MGRRIITFELRHGKDDDIDKALTAALSGGDDRSDVLRKALRTFFGLLGGVLGSAEHEKRASDLLAAVDDAFELGIELECASGDSLDAGLDSLLDGF